MLLKLIHDGIPIERSFTGENRRIAGLTPISAGPPASGNAERPSIRVPALPSHEGFPARVITSAWGKDNRRLNAPVEVPQLCVSPIYIYASSSETPLPGLIMK